MDNNITTANDTTDSSMNIDVQGVRDLLGETFQELTDKKEAQKQMNAVAKDGESASGGGVKASTWKFCKKVKHTMGKGWSGGPLSLDSSASVKDSTSQLFIKLKELVENLRLIGHIDYLDEYVDALKTVGIDITIDPGTAKVDPAESEDRLIEMCAYQETIDDAVDKIKEEHAQRSEDLTFAPKSKYAEIATLYAKIKDGKDVDDEYQNKVTNAMMYETALNLVYDGAIDAPGTH